MKHSLVLSLLAFGCCVTSAAAQQQLAAAQAVVPIDSYFVGRAKPPIESGQTMVDMTLDEAIQIALEWNLDLQAARFSPQAADYQLASARAAFTPRLTGQYGYNSQSSPNNSTILDPTLTAVTQVRQIFSSGFSQTLPWHGTARRSALRSPTIARRRTRRRRLSTRATVPTCR